MSEEWRLCGDRRPTVVSSFLLVLSTLSPKQSSLSFLLLALFLLLLQLQLTLKSKSRPACFISLFLFLYHRPSHSMCPSLLPTLDYAVLPCWQSHQQALIVCSFSVLSQENSLLSSPFFIRCSLQCKTKNRYPLSVSMLISILKCWLVMASTIPHKANQIVWKKEEKNEIGSDSQLMRSRVQLSLHSSMLSFSSLSFLSSLSSYHCFSVLFSISLSFSLILVPLSLLHVFLLSDNIPDPKWEGGRRRRRRRKKKKEIGEGKEGRKEEEKEKEKKRWCWMRLI